MTTPITQPFASDLPDDIKQNARATRKLREQLNRKGEDQ